MSGTLPNIAATGLLLALVGCTGSYEPTDPEGLKNRLNLSLDFLHDEMKPRFFN